MKDSMLAVGFRDVSNMWLQDYYQLANRLSTIAYLQSKGIKAKVLYIYFENKVFNLLYPFLLRNGISAS